MYKILLILIGLYGCNTQFVSGQNHINYKLGFTGGINAAQIQNSGGTQAIRWSYNSGIILEQRFFPNIGLVYQLLYSRQGENVNLRQGGIGPVVGHQYIKFDYVSLPIMIRFKPKSEHFFLDFGGQIGKVLNARIDISAPFNQGKPFDHVNELDFGLTGGLGYRFGKHIVADARYYYGMRQILSDFTNVDPLTGQIKVFSQDKWFNRVYSLNLGYFF